MLWRDPRGAEGVLDQTHEDGSTKGRRGLRRAFLSPAAGMGGAWARGPGRRVPGPAARVPRRLQLLLLQRLQAAHGAQLLPEEETRHRARGLLRGVVPRLPPLCASLLHGHRRRQVVTAHCSMMTARAGLMHLQEEMQEDVTACPKYTVLRSQVGQRVFYSPQLHCT